MRLNLRRLSAPSKRLSAIFGAACAAALLLAGNGAVAAGTPRISDFVADKLDDFTAVTHVDHFDDRAGSKINKDFGLIYQLTGDVMMRYKKENRVRLDGRLAASKVVFIVAGTKQYVKISLGIRTTDDLSHAPGKRKTLLDVGLISNGYLAYTEAEYQGTRPIAGVMCETFRISYRDKGLDTSYRTVWIDPKTHVTLKREEHSQTGQLVATFYYLKPVEVAPGIWFPTHIEIRNNQGQQAVAQTVVNVKVNNGMDDGLFQL